MKFTSEPWEIFYANRDGNNGMPAKETAIEGDYEIIATMHGNKQQQNANAALIATSPMLLEACRGLLDMITNNRLHGPEVIFAADAIAAAEGGA